MRYRLMATYRGVPYEAGIGPTDDDVVLFAACPPPEELGFEPATGHWRKQLRLSEVQSLWESRPMGTFRGERCMVLDDLGDRLHIAYLGHDSYRAEQLGFWEVDRGVFEVITPREEVTEIAEDRRGFPRQPGPGSNGHPVEPGLLAQDPLLTGPPGRVDRDLAVVPPGAADRELALVPPAREDHDSLARERPLPLEEAARLAASARAAASAQTTILSPDMTKPDDDKLLPAPGPVPVRRRASADRHLATQRTFAELAGLAAIPSTAFAIGEEVDGAMCLVKTAAGYEVFNAAEGARHEVRVFDDEESAYFYLFGILAAEAVRTGRLIAQG
jgi:hypothetical protein